MACKEAYIQKLRTLPFEVENGIVINVAQFASTIQLASIAYREACPDKAVYEAMRNCEEARLAVHDGFLKLALRTDLSSDFCTEFLTKMVEAGRSPFSF